MNMETPPRNSPSLAERFAIVAILLLAAGLRFIDLERVPPPFNVDEAVNAYDAYSLLKTGRDQWGRPWPITMRAFNDYRRPGTIYTAIPFVALFGLNIFSIRAMAAFMGWLCVLFTYRLARDMFDRRAGLLAGLMLTLSPWHLGFSRVGLEACGPMLTTVTIGVWCGWRWYKSRKPGWLISAGIAFGLSFYTYTTVQAFTPLLLAVCGVLFFREFWEQRRIALLTLAVFVVIVAPLAWAVVTNDVTWNRLNAISMFQADQPITQSLINVGKQWLGHFTPRYLFLQGDAQKVHHAKGFGQLYWIDALLVLLGLGNLLRKKHNWRASLLILAWIALGAVPAALTMEDMGTAHSMRGMLGIPGWAILIGLGAHLVWDAKRITPRWRTVLMGILAGALAWNASLVLQNYYVVYPVDAARAFEYGIREAMDYATAHEDEYETIVLTNWISQPHIFAVFFQRYDPHEFQQTRAPYGDQLSEKLTSWGTKYMTGNVDELYPTMENTLFIARPHMLPDVEPLLMINHPDGSPAFKIIAK